MADESLHINHGLIALGLQLSASLGKIGEGRSFDANREYVDPNCPIGEDEIEVVAAQAAFSREVTPCGWEVGMTDAGSSHGKKPRPQQKLLSSHRRKPMRQV